MNKAIVIIEGVIGNVPPQHREPGENYVELIDVVSQVESYNNNFDQIELRISTDGGSVPLGEEIISYLKSFKKPIHAIGYGIIASMGARIFCECDTRELMPGSELMIHLPSGGVKGSSNDIKEYSDMMESLVKESKDFYSRLTGVSQDLIFKFLEQETWIDEQKAFELGFTTVAPKQKRAVAHFNNYKTKPQMADQVLSNEQKESILQMITNFFTETFGAKSDKKTEDVKNLIRFDASENEIDFYELEEGQAIEVGARARVSGQDATGSFVMPNGDTLVFEAGTLTEIIEDQTSVLKEENEKLKEDLANNAKELSEAKEQKEKLEADVLQMKNKMTEFQKTITSKLNLNIKEGKEEKKEVIDNPIKQMVANMKRK